MASYTDVDDLVDWIGSEQTENLGGTTGVVKPAMKPTLLFPFAAPRVAESPVAFECKVSQIVQLQGANGDQVPSWLVLGEAIAIHIDESLLDEGIYQTARAQPILRAGGPSAYAAIGPENRFDMRRPG